MANILETSLRTTDIFSTTHADTEIAQSILTSVLQHGFFYLTGHHISDSLIGENFKSAERFFSQGRDKKLLCVSKDKAKRGYSDYCSDNFGSLVGESKPNDLVEKFRIGPTLTSISVEHDQYYKAKEAKKYFFPNSFENAAACFHPVAVDYYEHMQRIALRTLELFEVGLQYPNKYFSSVMDKHTSIMAFNYYPHLDDPHIFATHQYRIAEHTDISMFTIITLNESSQDSLEVRSPLEDTVWTPVKYIPGTLVVLIGDCFKDWTNNELPASRHRVALPHPNLDETDIRETSVWINESIESVNNIKDNTMHYKDNDRYSIAYFVSPNYDANMSPIFHGNDYDNISDSSLHTTSIVSATSQSLPDIDYNNTSVPNRNAKNLTYSKWRQKKIRQAMQLQQQYV